MNMTKSKIFVKHLYKHPNEFNKVNGKMLPLIFDAMDEYAKHIIESVSDEQILRYISFDSRGQGDEFERGAKWFKEELLKKLK